MCKIIKVKMCISSNEESYSCEYAYWRIDSLNKRLIAICGEEEKFIQIFLPPNTTPDIVDIPKWCPLEDYTEDTSAASPQK